MRVHPHMRMRPHTKCVCRSWTLHQLRVGASKLFKKYDRDQSGNLDVEELKVLLLGLGKEITLEDIKKYISMGRGFGLKANKGSSVRACPGSHCVCDARRCDILIPCAHICENPYALLRVLVCTRSLSACMPARLHFACVSVCPSLSCRVLPSECARSKG